MKRFLSQIKNLIKDLNKQDNVITASVVFPPEFTVFEGHFPDKPILPGICMVQLVKVIVELSGKNKFEISEIKLAKFYAPVNPNDKLSVECNLSLMPDNQLLVKTVMNVLNQKVAQVEIVGKIS